jgi:Domain of unknown function (DUF4190)
MVRGQLGEEANVGEPWGQQGGGVGPPAGGFGPPPVLSVAKKYDPLAIASLVLSVVGTVLCCVPCIGYISPVLYVAGIVTGAISLGNLKKDPSLSGKELAIAGIAISALFVVVWIGMMVFGVGATVLSSVLQQAQRRWSGSRWCDTRLRALV